MSLLHSLWIWFITLAWTGIICTFLIPFALFKRRRMVHRVGRIWGRLLATIHGMRIEVENPRNLPTGGPVLLVANHQSFLDMVAFMSVIRVPFGAMAKASLFRIPLFGSVMRGAGCIPVHRDDRKKAMESLMQAARSVRAGNSLMVFPEGSRSLDETRLLPFKKGAFILVRKAAVPIVPITIFGANRLMPPKQRTFIQRVRPGTIRMVVHQTLVPADYAGLSVDELQSRMYRTISRPLERLRQITAILENRKS